MKITLYFKPACVQCDATKRALDRRGLPYDLIDLTQDPQAFEFVTGLGHRQAPVVVVVIDDRLHAHWSGYQPSQISAL